jgi:hypothetical protein
MFDTGKSAGTGYTSTLAAPAPAALFVQPRLGVAASRGAIFVEQSPFLPLTLRLESDATRPGWARVANSVDGAQLERNLTAAGWNSFFIAGVIKTTAFGFNRQETTLHALRRLIANVKVDQCNCVEIDEVTPGFRYGLPCVTVMAHARRIQKENLFRSH